MDPTKKNYLSDVAGSMPSGGYSVDQLGTIASRAGIVPAAAPTPTPTPTPTTTTPPTTPDITSPYQDQLKTFANIAKTGSPFTESDRQAEIKRQQDAIASQIDAIDSAKREEIQRLREQTANTLGGIGAQAARGGFAGTPFAQGQENLATQESGNKEVAIVSKYRAAKDALMKAAMEAADQRLKDKAEAMQKGSEAYLAYLKADKENKQKQLSAALQKLMLQGHDITSIDVNDYATKFGLDPKDAEEALVTTVTEARKAALDKAPESVKEYEYATQHGYKGTYEQYQNEDANRKAVIARAGAQVLGQGGMTPAQATQFSGIVNNYSKSPLIAAKDRTVVLRDAIKQAEANPSSGPAQLTLIYGYVQALDTYQSAVREGELQLVNSIDSKIGQIGNYVTQVENGQIVRPEAIKNIAKTAQTIVDAIDRGAKQKENMYRAQANVIGLGPQWDEFSKQSKQIQDVSAQTQSSFIFSPDGRQKVDTSTLTPAELQEAKSLGWK